MTKLRIGLGLLALLALAGCVIDTVPTPDGTGGDEVAEPSGSWDFPSDRDGSYPRIPASKLFYSLHPGGDALFVVGVAGATSGAGLVRASNDGTGARVEKPTAADGSFSLTIDAALHDLVLLRYFVSEVALLFGYLIVEPAPAAAVEASADLAAAVPVAPSDGGIIPEPGVYATAPSDGWTTVVGVDGLLSPGMTVVVANVSGSAASTSVTESGGFLVLLRAASGDHLKLFAAETATSQAGGPVTSISVP